MGERVKISDIPDGKEFEDYPEDTLFVWEEDEEEDEWFPHNIGTQKK